MSTRYNNRTVLINKDELYESLLEDRNLTQFRQYDTPPRLRQPSIRQMRKLTRISHIWKTGDRYYKLSHKYYGSTDFWWVIAQFNQKPTDSHVRLGQTIQIPLPLEQALRAMGRG